MNKYKKHGGWYGESYRHYLASKRIKTTIPKNKYFLSEVLERPPERFIDTPEGEAEYVKTEIEDENGGWDDKYPMREGYYVVDEGKKHHVYQIKDAYPFFAKKKTIYEEKGYRDRKDYLESLANQYDISSTDVFWAAKELGEAEDFKMLPKVLEELGEEENFYAKKEYFVQNEFKGNRSSPALHRAYAYGHTKEELMSNPSLRQQFGVDLAELEKPTKRLYPEGLSEAQKFTSTIASEPLPEPPIVEERVSEPVMAESVMAAPMSPPTSIEKENGAKVATPGVPSLPRVGFNITEQD